MEYKILCDYSENFASKSELGLINDHQDQKTFEEINAAIKDCGYHCEIFGGVPELLQAYENQLTFNKNIIFINLSDGMDQKYSRVQIPVLCDMLHLQYSGGGTFEIALTSNKYYTSMALREYGIQTPKSILLTHMDNFNIPFQGKYMVKPNSEGSSIGISQKSICKNKEIAKHQVCNLLSSYSEVLIEEYIPGYDVTCFIIGNEDILLDEVLAIKHHNKLFFDNEVLGNEEHLLETREFLPSEKILSRETENTIKNMSITIKNYLHIYDFCRIDYRITSNNEVFFLEINTVPAINMKSQVGVICKKLNIDFKDFLKMIIDTVTKRFNNE